MGNPNTAHAVRLRIFTACLLAAACGGSRAPTGQVELRFVDYVDHQAFQVTTSKITPGEGTELLGSGWISGELELVARGGRLQFFSAEASIQGFELTLENPLPPGVALAAWLNGRELGPLKHAGNPRTYYADFLSEAVLEGWNNLWLELSAVEEAVAPATVAMAEIRFLPAMLTTAASIRAGSDAPTHEQFSMPGSSYIDVVSRLPESPRWTGRFDVVFREGSPIVPVAVRAELLDAAGTSHELWQRLFHASATGEGFRLTLQRWAGQLVRLRLRVAGGGDVEVRWVGSRVTGEGQEWTPPIATGDSWLAPPITGRLGRPDVFVVLLDAARADALGCYGASRPTPAIDALAQHGTRFANALTSAPWTGPAVPAILTGLYPDTLGINHWGSRLPPEVALVQELALNAGYHTLLWTQHPGYRDHLELRRGFAAYRRGAQDLRQQLPGSEDLLRADQPTFAVIHLLPPHTPYEPPAPFRGSYTSDYRGSVPVDARFLNSFPNRRRPEELSAEDRRYIRGRYLENVAFADSLVRRLVDLLQKHGRFDDALVIVLSDHGEGFLEHQHFLHCRLLYGEFLRVPLVVKWPAAFQGFEPIVEAPVSLIDLTPTLVDGLALDSTGRRFQGISLLSQVLGEAPTRRALYAVTRGAARSRNRPRPSAMVRLDGWKLILDLESRNVELYHLTSDPWERDDRAATEPARVELLRQLLYRQRHLNTGIRAGLSAPDEQALDSEVSHRLQALGYL